MAAQPYIITVRNGGQPQTGLASQINGSALYYNAAGGAQVTTGLPTWSEVASTGRYLASYDAAAGPALVAVLDCGSSLTDPNERYATVALLADPANVDAAAASTATLLSRVPQALLFDSSGFVKADAQVLPTTPPSGYGGSGGSSVTDSSVQADVAATLDSYTIDGTVTLKQELEVLLAEAAGKYTDALSGGTLSVTYDKQDGSTPIVVSTVSVNSTTGEPTAATHTLENL